MAHGEEFSDSFNKDKPWSSPWLSSKTSTEEMAKKSVLKALLKYAPKSVEGQIESALCSDGHAVIADKFEKGGNMKLDFDIKRIAPPDPEMPEMTNRINGAGTKTEPVSASRFNIEEAAPPPQAAENGATRRGGALFPDDEAEDLEGALSLPLSNKARNEDQTAGSRRFVEVPLKKG